MTASIQVGSGIAIGGGITIGPQPVQSGPTTPTLNAWTFDPGYVGDSLALGAPGDWNTASTNTPYLEAYATNPESSIAIGQIGGGTYSLYDYASFINDSVYIMFTMYINTEDPSDVPLDLAAVGVAYLAADLNNPLGNDGNSWGYRQDGSIWQGGSQIADGYPTWGPGDYIDIALNLYTANAWVRVNGGNWQGQPGVDPASNTNGQPLNMVVTGTTGTATAAYPAVNPGAQNFVDAIDISLYTYTVPSGFVSM